MEYRFYAFGNYYLSSLQQGLQAGHCVSEMFVQHAGNNTKAKITMDWGKHHKTMVLLNGGNSGSLATLFNFFKELKRKGMPYPFVCFHEDEVSLGGALTDVAIILPDSIYENAANLRNRVVTMEELEAKHKKWEIMLMVELNKYGLAH